MRLDFLSEDIIFGDFENVFSAGEDWEKLDNSKIFISGASGMIASYIVMFLIYLNEIKQFNIQIYAGIRNRKKAEARFGEYVSSPYFNLIEGDVCNFEFNGKLDYIIHAASLASPQFYGKMPVETMLPNIIGTYKLLEYAKINSVKSFLFFSSGAVYGDSDNSTIKEDFYGKFDYMAPGSVYGESKRCGEALCSAYFREFNIPVKTVRIHHVYGPTLDLQNDKRAFSEFVKNIVDNQNIEMKSDGSQKRAFCYLSDALNAICHVLLCGKNNESYNLANASQFVSIRKLAETLITLYPQKDLKVVYRQREDEGYLSLSHSVQVCCSTEKIQSLGCEFKIDIKEGFKRTIDYFINKA